MRKPNFFIVGAPKCGTSAMNYYLKQHPDIFIPESTKINFFGKDLNFTGRALRDRKKYLDLFSSAKKEKMIGETSVWYLYSKTAAKEIKKFSPNAKIIIMLRNPVEMLYSRHSQFLWDGNEDIADFRLALESEKDRLKGSKIPNTSYFVDGLFYTKGTNLLDQVKRYVDVFGKENVQIIIFDDLKKDSAKVYKDTLRFLGVDENFRANLKVINPNKKTRSKKIHSLLMDTPLSVRGAGKSVLPKSLRVFLRDNLTRLNTSFQSRKSIDPELKKELGKKLSPEVRRLEKYLDRDLSSWTKN